LKKFLYSNHRYGSAFDPQPDGQLSLFGASLAPALQIEPPTEEVGGPALPVPVPELAVEASVGISPEGTTAEPAVESLPEDDPPSLASSIEPITDEPSPTATLSSVLPAAEQVADDPSVALPSIPGSPIEGFEAMFVTNTPAPEVELLEESAPECDPEPAFEVELPVDVDEEEVAGVADPAPLPEAAGEVEAAYAETPAEIPPQPTYALPLAAASESEEEATQETAAPETLLGLATSLESRTFDPKTVTAEMLGARSLEELSPVTNTPTVSLHKHGKRLLVKANDVAAADVWREISARLKNERIGYPQYFDTSLGQEALLKEKQLRELWRWVEGGIEQHPYIQILRSYGVTIEVSPSLAGYMRNEKKRAALRSTPFPCYESSPDDITECILSGMILKCREAIAEGPFEVDKRYMVKHVTEDGLVEIYEDALSARTLLSDTSEVATLSKAEVQRYFEDSDKFVVTENVRDRYPELVASMEDTLASLAIGQDGRLFEHSRQDVVCEVPKGSYLCSKDMRMGKSRESIAACEMIGSRKVAWIGPAMANIDIPKEFVAGGVTDFKEIEKLTDLDARNRYHIMTFDFLKADHDPLSRVRRGNKSKTWLRRMGEGYSICDCPHCSQPMERPVHVKAMNGRILRTTWTLFNGYLCRNPYCTWVEVTKPRKASRKLGKQVIAPTPWHRAGEPHSIAHRGGYVDWERKQHADCGDHVGRKRFCPKCGLADAAWKPAIYKRIKKNYKTVVIDEIHMTKDSGSKTNKAALDMRGKHHIGNSGTPMSKDLVDMFEQLMWLFKTKSSYFPFDRATGKPEFKERFCENIRIEREGTDRVHYKTLPYARDPVDFWNFVAPLLVRRTRRDPVYLASLEQLGLKLPSESLFVMPVRMVPPQALLLSASIGKFEQDFADYCRTLEEEGKSLNSHIVMTMMSRMKIAATIPGFLNRPGKPVVYDGGSIDPMGIGGKGVALASLVPAKIIEGKKVVIMSQFVMMRQKLAEKFAHLQPVLLPSGTVAEKRRVLDEFRLNRDRFLSILGPKQVCLGVELNCADVLINVDLMWEAGAQKQALARLMGPTTYERNVENFILNSEHSMDEHVYDVFFAKIAGQEQALDKRVITRSAQSVNWIAFADALIAQRASLEGYFRGSGEDEGDIAMPELPEVDDLMLRCA